MSAARLVLWLAIAANAAAAATTAKPTASTGNASAIPASGSATTGAPSTCSPSDAVAGPGVVDPFHAPTERATALNAEGKLLYRQGRWDDARAKYRAAEAADPDFLAPALNVACSFVRQERFAEAVAEVHRLLDRAYLPWSAEILSAADLGALKVRDEGKELRAAIDAARGAWAAGLTDDVILLARLRQPLKLGDQSSPTAGAALVLGPRQELVAWSPTTRRYRQLTSEEGRVLAFARSTDGRRLAYVTAEKLIRGRDAGDPDALRGAAISELELGTLSSLGRAPVAGDLRRLDILVEGAAFAYRIETGSGAGPSTFALVDGRLEPRRSAPAGRPAVTLTGHGVSTTSTATSTSVSLRGACAGTARDRRSPSGAITVVIRDHFRGHARDDGPPAETTIGGPFGASLAGLPIP